MVNFLYFAQLYRLAKVKKMRKVSILIFLFFIFYGLKASPGYPYPVEIIQPDGTKITLLIKGDEFCRYKTTLNGYIVAENEDGFYYYADYNSGKLSLSTHRVTSSKAPLSGYAKSIPKDVCNLIENANGKNDIDYAADVLTAQDNMPRKIKAIIIPVEFKDVKFLILPAKEHFDNLVNMEGYSEYGATGSVKDYFKANNIEGYIEPEFVVTDVVSLPEDISYYGNNEENSDTSVLKYDVKISQMVIDACKIIDPVIDFSQFDNDKDGRVDNVFLYYAGYSEAEGGSSTSIWPLSSTLKETSLYLDGVRIYSYACASELRGASGNIPSGIGVFCHEFCHILGMKDLYDTDYEANGQGKGLWGTLSIMDYGCYNNQGKTPPYFCAIDRELAQCGAGQTLEKDKRYVLQPISEKGLFYKVPTDVENEYFLLETREESGWDEYIGGEGMLIYHIDKSDNIAGAIQASVRWRTNTINTYSGHECADLVEANPLAVNVRQAFFPGLSSVNSFTALTNPAFLGWNIKNVGLKLTDIKMVEEGVSFLVSEEKNERMLNVVSPKISAYQTSAVLKWSSDLQAKGNWGIRWKLKSDESDEFSEVEVSEMKYQFKNLEEGSGYMCQIFYKGDNSNGDTTTVSFKTLGITSNFPFIYGIKEKMYVGDTLTLSVFNVTEAVKTVDWYVNNTSVQGNQYVFTKEGIVTLSAQLSYISDKSLEVITRKIIISKKEEDEQ